MGFVGACYTLEGISKYPQSDNRTVTQRQNVIT